MKDIQTTRTQEIVSLHNEIMGHLRQSLEKAIRIGQLLSEQKDGLKHGKWLPWVEVNLPFTDRTARNYMQVFREKDKLKTETVSDLNSAYALLAEPKQIDLLPDQKDLSLLDLSIDELQEMIAGINSLIKEKEYHVSTDSIWFEKHYKQDPDGSMTMQECKSFGLAFNILKFFCFYKNLFWRDGLSGVSESVRDFITGYGDEPIDKEPRKMCGEHCQFNKENYN